MCEVWTLKCLTVCLLGGDVRVQRDEGQSVVEVKELTSLSWTPPSILKKNKTGTVEM